MSADGTAPDERGVKRGLRLLSVVLTAEERAHVADEMAALEAAKEDAEAELERIKSTLKEQSAGASGRVASLDASAKARIYREGRVMRDVAVTIRTDWTTRRRTITRDDTGEVVESSPASQEDLDALCSWVTEGVTRKLLGPDGSVVKTVPLPDAERQGVLPAVRVEKPAGEGTEVASDDVPDAEPGTARVWIHGGAWRHLDHKDSDRLEKPDPKGPAVTWTADGDWFRADVPITVLSQVEAHARKAEVRFFTQHARPNLADLMAQTEEEPTRLNPKGKRRGALPPRE